MDPILLFAGFAALVVVGVGIFGYLNQNEESVKNKIKAPPLKKEIQKVKKKIVSKKKVSKQDTPKAVDENKDKNATTSSEVKDSKPPKQIPSEKPKEKKEQKKKGETTTSKKQKKQNTVEPSKEDMELLNWQRDVFAEEKAKEEDSEPTTTIPDAEWKVVKKTDEVEVLKKRIAELEAALSEEKKKTTKLNYQIENMKDFHKKQMKEKKNKENELREEIAKVKSKVRSDKKQNGNSTKATVWKKTPAISNGTSDSKFPKIEQTNKDIPPQPEVVAVEE